ncbi:MAG: SAF domain-containing protein, partial [Clostridia bacterium]|nr:SAF domain-containing protein [Clostridia bacterium]
MKLPKRLLIALVCFGLAAVLFFVGIPILRSGTAKTVTAVRAAVPIAKGERIEEAQIRFEEIGAYGLQDGVLTDPGR